VDERQIASRLIAYIEEELLDEDDDAAAIDAQTSLFESGRLDSMSLSSLILFIEDQVGVRIGPMDISYETFDTVERMVALIARKQDA